VLRVACRLSDTEAEGPGRRFAVWVQGCPIRCAGCCNPEMFDERGGREIAVAELVRELAEARGRGVEGLTLLGGEPFAQAAPASRLARAARELGLTVMVFSGYTRAELEARGDDGGAAALLAATDILVDGQYRRELPEPPPPLGRRWVGSSNQVIHRLSEAAQGDRRLDAGGAGGNTVELRLSGATLTINGWPAAADHLRPRRSAAKDP
jgi:anaerobic ribonucleoside-triphosphate reductase activating protein